MRQGESIGFLPGKRSFAQQRNLDAAGNWLEFDQDNNGDGRFELQQVRTHNAAGDIVGLSPSSAPPGAAAKHWSPLTPAAD